MVFGSRLRVFAICAVLIFVVALPICSLGQAVVPPKGVGSVGISYQTSFVREHLFSRGEKFVIHPYNNQPVSLLGQIRFQAVFIDASYSITDQLAISGSIPYISGKFIEDGGNPNPNALFGNAHVVIDPDGSTSIPVDDGEYHGGFQDLQVRLRYNVKTSPLLLTPFIEYNAPTNEYPFYSHAVYGNRVAEFKLGSYFGRVLDPVIPNTYIQGRYAFGFLQRIIGISHTRHHGEVEVGYFLTPSITVTGLLIGFYTNGGLALPDDFPRPYDSSNELFLHHTQISQDSLLDWGIGFQYSLNDRLTFYAGGLRTITGRNMHATDYGTTFGMVWGFGGSPQRPCHC